MLSSNKISKIITTFYFLYSLISQINCQTTTSSQNLVLGVGIGTLIIIIAIAFSLVWCLACRASSRPELYGSIGIIVPIVLIIAFIFTPKQSSRTTTSTTVSDSNFIPHLIFVLIALIGLLVALGMILLDWIMTNKKAKSIARSAFVLRDQDDFENQNERFSRNSRVSRGSRSINERERNQRQQLIS